MTANIARPVFGKISVIVRDDHFMCAFTLPFVASLKGMPEEGFCVFACNLPERGVREGFSIIAGLSPGLVQDVHPEETRRRKFSLLVFYPLGFEQEGRQLCHCVVSLGA